jgi:deoxyribose-phosphate aldolase
MENSKITITIQDVAKMIDHSLLHPTLTDEDLKQGCQLAKDLGLASACVKPYATSMTKDYLSGTDVLVCPVIGFPAGNSSIQVKVYEAQQVLADGAQEVDMVVNVGKVLGLQWDYIYEEINAINSVVVAGGAILKVIFETDYLQSQHIVKLCEICSQIGVAFVKTSTGYGFVKQNNGYNYTGATIENLKLMRAHCPPNVQIKAAGGVRTLDDLLTVRSVGVSRIGATASVAILEEAKKRGISDIPTTVSFIYGLGQKVK